jgi:thermostable 8-oxoguanine DNA glycosylase
MRNNLLNPANFERDDATLEEWLLLCIFVAGKSSKVQAEKLKQFYEVLGNPEFIISKLRELSLEEIRGKLSEIKSGQYDHLSQCLFELSRANLDLRKCSVDDLEKIHRIGMKTSRFFLVYSRFNCNYAILDTHILKWLSTYAIVPKSTPGKKQYLILEKLFLEKCKELNLNPYELDITIWKEKQKSYNFEAN